MQNSINSRLIKLLNTNQINQEQYELLIKSLYNKNKLSQKIFNFFINPFEMISTQVSFIIGLLLILAISYMLYISNCFGSNVCFYNKHISYWYTARIYSIIWCSISLIFFIVSKLLGGVKLRLIDFFATCGLAMLPLFLIFFIDGISYLFDPKLLNPPPHEKNLFIIIYSFVLDTTAILLIFWYVVFNFFAFKMSSGLSYHRNWFGFVVAMILIKVLISIWLMPLVSS
jgi:hypothetical protein